MKINIQDIITLDDQNEYVVVSKVLFKKDVYICIMDINNHLNIKYILVKDDYLSIIDDNEVELLNILIPLFYKNSYEKME